MSAKTTGKRPVRASAVVGIVVWSTVFCLLGALLVAGLNGVGFRVLQVNGFPILSFGGFTYEDAETYRVGNATVTDTITDLSINWLAGDVTIVASDTDEIIITEDYRGGDDDLRLRWKIEEGELTVQFRKPVLFGTVDSMKKDLTVAIPVTMLEALDEVEIKTVAGNVSFTGNADELTLDAVEGDLTVNGDIGELNVNAVEGKAVFKGAVRRAEFDCVDAEVTMYLHMAAELTFNQVDGDVTLHLSEEITGFSAELDSLGSEIVAEGFDGLDRESNRNARWGDGSLRIRMNGVDNQLEIKKVTKN